MEHRHLGKSGLKVSAVGLGCLNVSGSYGESDEKESIATIQRAIDFGVDFLDTSDAYGDGYSEELVARAVSSHRERVTLATKFGNLRLPDGTRITNGRPEYVREACHKSLKRLNTEVIDLYYQHRVDPDVPIEETVGAMARLIEDGQVRYIGLCEAASQTIRRAYAVHPLAAVQMEYSLWSRDAESNVLSTCRDLGIGFVAYSPLGRGFLTATVMDSERINDNDLRRSHPRFQSDNLVRNKSLLEPLKKLAIEKHCTPAQIALSWVLAQGDDVIPIPGTRQRSHLEENVRAIDVRLQEKDLLRLNKVFKPGAAFGERYPKAWLSRVNI